MALETVTTIYDLVATNPTGGDPKSQGDDHLRNIKAAVLASFAGTTGTSGYQKIGRAIVQWGSATTSATPEAPTVVTFPIAFPTACGAVVPGNRTSSSSGITIFAGNQTASQFSIGSSVASLGIFWIAVGY